MNKKGDISWEVVALVLALVILLVLVSYTPALARLIKIGIGYGKNADDEGALIGADTDQRPSPPRTLRVNPKPLSGPDERSYIISWQKSTSTNIEKYDVIREEEGKPPINICELPAAATQETYTCTDNRGDLKIDTKYKYTVIAYDFNGEYSEISDTIVPNK